MISGFENIVDKSSGNNDLKPRAKEVLKNQRNVLTKIIDPLETFVLQGP